MRKHRKESLHDMSLVSFFTAEYPKSGYSSVTLLRDSRAYFWREWFPLELKLERQLYRARSTNLVERVEPAIRAP